MIRLLSVQPVAERGGSDQALLRMVRSLPPADFDCHIALPTASPMQAEFTAAGATLHTVPMQRLSLSHRARDWVGYGAGWPVAVVRLASLVRRLDADLVHTNSLHSLYGWAAAALTRRAHVWHAREIVVQSRAALKVERFLARRFATTVICMSNAIAAQLDPSNVEIVYETADATEFRADLAGRFRERVGIPDNAPLAGAAGRIDTWKGFDVLLDAYERAKTQRPDIHLVVAGGAVHGKEELAAALAARAAHLPDVHWLGPRTDMPELYADLDLFVLPSTEPEPYGLVAVEALASGVPVVVTDAGGPPEIVARSARGSGRAVRPGDAAALAAAITELLPSTSGVASRRDRPSLQPPDESERFAKLFRQITEARHRGTAAAH
jgi:glycosyltransferase involved in cell wall biosynthesis